MAVCSERLCLLCAKPLPPIRSAGRPRTCCPDGCAQRWQTLHRRKLYRPTKTPSQHFCTLHYCLSCGKSLALDEPKYNSRLRCAGPNGCAEVWRKGRPKRSGWVYQKRYAKRKSIKHALCKAIDEAAPHMRTVVFERITPMYIPISWMPGGIFRIDGKKL